MLKVERLENWIDKLDEELPPLEKFILPVNNTFSLAGRPTNGITACMPQFISRSVRRESECTFTHGQDDMS